MYKVEKRDGSIVEFDKKKIEEAIYKASSSMKANADKVSKVKAKEYSEIITKKFEELKKEIIPIEDIQDEVENTLISNGYVKLAKSYIKYRRDHERMRETKSDLFKAIYSKADATDVQNQNANVDEHSFGGRRGEVTNIVMERLALDMMSEKQRERFLNNEIYPHDKDSYYVGMHNCLSIPYDDLINEDGFDTRQTDIRPSNSVNTTGQLVAVIGQLQSLQQFGGFAATHLDSTFVPTIRKSFKKNYDLASKIKYDKVFKDSPDNTEPIDSIKYKGKSIFDYKKKKVYEIAKQMTERELYQTCEAMYHNLNSLQSRSGNQLPFSSINYGADTSVEGRMATDAILSASIKGIGAHYRTSIFPCGIFQLKDGINNKLGDPNYDLKRKALYSTVKRFYPNYMNCDWSVQMQGIKKDREIKRKVIQTITNDMKQELIKIFKENPSWAEKINLKVTDNNSLIVTDKENPTELGSTMGCVDYDEVVTYKIKDKMYVESIGRMWDRIVNETSFDIKRQSRVNLNLYIDLNDVTIYDSNKKDFVECKRIIRNISRNWNKIYLSNGRVIDCTDDHPFPTNRGRIFAKDLKVNEDKIKIINNQYTEESNSLNSDLAWLYGIMICDGCLTQQLSCTFDFKTEKDIVDNIMNIMMGDKYDLDVVLKEYHRGDKGDYYQINGYEKEKRQKTRNSFINLFEGISKNERHIPSIIFTSDKETRLNFLAGMIDADGYVNTTKINCVQLGSVNKELSIQQMLLAQSLGMEAKIYENHYDSKDLSKIRYRIEFIPTSELISKLRCEKKRSKFVGVEPKMNNELEEVYVTKIESYTKAKKYSYDVTTESDHFDVSGIWSHNCRTYNGFDINFDEKYFQSLLKEIISQKKLPKNYLYSAMQKDGRGNIAPSTIIMPTIAMEARLEWEKDKTKDIFYIFLEKLKVAINDTKDFLIERYDHICSQKVSSAKFMYENNIMKGYIPSQGIKSALKHGTLAIGQIGLAETLQILFGFNHLNEEGMRYAKMIEQTFQNMCNDFKAQYKLNFGVYYTPAENLCYTSMKKFKKAFGDHPYVKELIKNGVLRDYFTNSIHVPVWEKVDPFKKIDIESQLTGYSNAGCITYVELDGKIADNIDAVEQILQYAKDKDCPYIAFNIPADCCLDCGFVGDFSESKKCVKCGSEHVLMPARVTGYLTGDYRTSFNKGKQKEKEDRVKHSKFMNGLGISCEDC